MTDRVIFFVDWENLYRGAFVNRRDAPYEDSPLQPDLTAASFGELADSLL